MLNRLSVRAKLLLFGLVMLIPAALLGKNFLSKAKKILPLPAKNASALPIFNQFGIYSNWLPMNANPTSCRRKPNMI
jgi:hypothetical protein